MKKILSMFLAALLLVSSACCGAMAEEPVTIQFWNSFTGADGAQLVQLVERFNEENEWGITVEMDISPSFTEHSPPPWPLIPAPRWCCSPPRSASSMPTTSRTSATSSK